MSAPPSPPGRIGGLDLARGLAMLGMLLVNFRVVLAPGAHALDSLLDGKAAALFVMVAGVGVSLMLRRGAPMALLRRAGVLFVGGLTFAAIWPGDILHFYGVYLALAVALHRHSDRVLLGATVGVVLGFVLLFVTLDWGAHWDWATFEYQHFWTLDGQVRHLLFNGAHPVFPWLAFLLFGMWLGRRDLRAPQVVRRMIWAGLVVAGVAHGLSALLVDALSPSLTRTWALMLVGTGPMPPLPLYVLAAGGSAVAVLGASLWIARRFAHRWLVRVLQTGGAFSLTVYFAHVLVGMTVIPLVAGPLTPTSATLWALGFWALMIGFARLWARRWGRGPAEWALRRMADKR